MADSTRVEHVAPDKQHSAVKKAFFWAITVAVMLLLFEAFASAVLLYGYRLQHADSTAVRAEVSMSSSVNLVYKVARAAGFFEFQRYRKETQPDPFFRPDARLGYSVSPGEYTHSYFHRPNPRSDWQSLKTKVTINEDGSRWTGDTRKGAQRSVYLFGDSWIFGSGVSDEHTFAHLLQQSRPDLEVKLFALAGYSLTQAYLRFEDLKESIGPTDIVVLGYADYYDTRHVQSPSRLRRIRTWNEERTSRKLTFHRPRASLVDDGKISVSYIQEDCLHNESFCEEADPSRVEMTRVTAALINHIADNSLANVYLLHIYGDSDNPVFDLTRNITRVSALSSDFDHFIRDDIEGFDPHPGPYWHYAISRRLLQVLSDS